MAWPSSLNVALKEWAVVCRALEAGRQVVLLRKGGIHDVGGEFELEHRQFLLFPTYLHQNLNMLKPSEHADFEPRTAEPEQVTIAAAGVVTDIVQLTDRAQMDALDAEHVWAPPLIDMRFNYRPENPLYLMIVRAFRLRTPAVLQNTPAYAGCKSWVPLDHAAELGEALPVLDDVKFDFRRKGVMEKLGGA